MADAGEAVDSVDFVQQHVGEDLADSGDGPQEEPGLGIVGLSFAEHLQLKPLQERVVMPDHLKVRRHVVSGALFGEAMQDVAIGRVSQRFLEGIEVVLVIDQLHVSEQFAPPSHQEGSASEQIAGATHFLGIDVAGGEVPASQEHGQFLGIDSIAFGFAALDGFR